MEPSILSAALSPLGYNFCYYSEQLKKTMPADPKSIAENVFKTISSAETLPGLAETLSIAATAFQTVTTVETLSIAATVSHALSHVPSLRKYADKTLYTLSAAGAVRSLHDICQKGVNIESGILAAISAIFAFSVYQRHTIHDEFTAKLEQLQTEHKTALNARIPKTEHDEKITELETKFQADLKTLQTEHNKKINEKTEHEAKIAESEQKLSQELQHLKMQLENIEPSPQLVAKFYLKEISNRCKFTGTEVTNLISTIFKTLPNESKTPSINTLIKNFSDETHTRQTFCFKSHETTLKNRGEISSDISFEKLIEETCYLISKLIETDAELKNYNSKLQELLLSQQNEHEPIRRSARSRNSTYNSKETTPPSSTIPERLMQDAQNYTEDVLKCYDNKERKNVTNLFVNKLTADCARFALVDRLQTVKKQLQEFVRIKEESALSK